MLPDQSRKKIRLPTFIFQILECTHQIENSTFETPILWFYSVYYIAEHREGRNLVQVSASTQFAKVWTNMIKLLKTNISKHLNLTKYY